mmetsp:Transcript_16934/g.66065  ORF Transcript_16934/g.66065 Transcript_16934/m.66065 type:complete len:231 (+) Transcript_16934:638-1330(+)
MPEDDDEHLRRNAVVAALQLVGHDGDAVVQREGVVAGDEHEHSEGEVGGAHQLHDVLRLAGDLEVGAAEEEGQKDRLEDEHAEEARVALHRQQEDLEQHQHLLRGGRRVTVAFAALHCNVEGHRELVDDVGQQALLLVLGHVCHGVDLLLQLLLLAALLEEASQPVGLVAGPVVLLLVGRHRVDERVQHVAVRVERGAILAKVGHELLGARRARIDRPALAHDHELVEEL